MNKYDSLAQQVAEDFRSTMLAMSSMQKTMMTMNRDFKRVRISIRKMYRTIQAILQHDEETDARLEALESWQKQVDARLTA